MVVMTLHLENPAEVENSDVVIPAGESVEYEGHVVGGMIRVNWNGTTYVINPRTTKELR